MIILILSRNKTYEMKNGTYPGLDPLERLLWSVLPRVTRLISVICVASSYYGQKGIFASGIDDCRSITENVRH